MIGRLFRKLFYKKRLHSYEFKKGWFASMSYYERQMALMGMLERAVTRTTGIEAFELLNNGFKTNYI